MHPSELVFLEHRVERLIEKDEMIQYTYSKQLTSLDKPLRDSDIVCTGVEHATGMVVGYDDRCRPSSQWIRKDLSLYASERDNEIFAFFTPVSVAQVNYGGNGSTGKNAIA